MKEEFKLMNLKGTSDFLPEEQIIRNKITDTLKSTFEKYGFLPLETPILCYYDLLASKYAGGAEILKEVYKFKDQGLRDIGLRYDLTVPFSKVIGMNKGLILPFKRYEIGKVFRDGPVKLGRAREFYQCDVDACGVESPYADIEYFTMVKEVFEEFNIPVEIRYNNRKFLSGLLEYVKVPKENISAFITYVDKLDKLKRDDIESELEECSSKEIVDEVFNDVTYNVPGKLYITGPCLMNEYYNRPDLTQKAIYVDEEGTRWYSTGDYAVMDADGCLTVLDRYSEPVDITYNGQTEKVNLLDIMEIIKKRTAMLKISK